MFLVPTYSQYVDITAHGWKCRSCGPVAVSMVLAYYGKHRDSLDNVLEKGVALQAHNATVGWYHQGLVRLAQMYGVDATAHDWYQESAVLAFEKLMVHIHSGPLIASVHKYFNPHEGGHLIVVTGYDGHHIYYNEPASKKGTRYARKVSQEKFLIGWKRRVITFYVE